MESVGARLKQVRMEKGVSLDDVQKRTKIHITVLKAIEEDSVSHLSPIYLRGFIKIYCKYLGVDPGDYISGYVERTQGSTSETPPPAPLEDKAFSLAGSVTLVTDFIKKYIKPKMVVAVIVGIVGLLIVIKLGQAIGHYRATHRGLPAREARAVRPEAPVKIKTPSSKVSTKADKKAASAASQKADHAAAAAAAASTASSAAAPSQSSLAPEPPAEAREIVPVTGVRLGIRAKEDSWVQLKTDGHLIFQGVLKKGRFETWHANDKMELSLGNAGVVDLEVNGRIIEGLGRKGQSLKNILITKDGLKTKR